MAEILLYIPQTVMRLRRLSVLLVTLSVLLHGCSFSDRDGGPDQPFDVAHIPDAIPKHEKRTRAGNPDSYKVLGKSYRVMRNSNGFVERGIASWYGKKFHGRKTANGETYDMYAMTAAHKTLPIPTYVEVTNLDNGRRATVRINDRGPFHDNRIIDLSYSAARKLGIVSSGTGMVEIRAVEPGQKRTRVKSSGTSAKPRIYLQLGSFIKHSNAESLRTRLTLKNIGKTSIQKSTVARRKVYRVRIGPIATVADANRITAKITALGFGDPTMVID